MADQFRYKEIPSTSSINGYSYSDFEEWSSIDEGITLTWSDINVYAQIKEEIQIKIKKILNDVSGAIKPGSLTALMGPSGSGKSTLMSALTSRNMGNLSIDGKVLVNGRPTGPYLKHISGFVHQDDIFIGSLTVLEHMNFMANLKLHKHISLEEKTTHIHNILKELNLIKCLHTRIGLIGEDKLLSGGEKKRLAVAAELLTDPPLLFCDEPTTGLDSFSAEEMIGLLNKITEKKKTILCTIHQPSSYLFSMFAQIILLVEGRVAFIGSKNSAMEFLHSLGYVCPRSYNPADFLLKTLSVDTMTVENSRNAIKNICDQFLVSEYAKENYLLVQYQLHMTQAIQFRDVGNLKHWKKSLWWSAFLQLTYRYIIDLSRDPSLQLFKIVQKLALGIIIGLCYFDIDTKTQNGIQSVQGILFLFISENTFAPMYSAIESFPRDFPLFIREYESGLYSPSVYYISKIISTIPGLIFEATLFVVIAYWIAGLDNNVVVFSYTIFAAILNILVSSACGVFFANLFSTSPSAMAYLVPFDALIMITCGVFIKLGSLPVIISWIRYISWMMYSYEIMTIVQWINKDNIECDIGVSNVPCITNGKEVLDLYSFSQNNLNFDIVCSTLLCIIFYVLGFICMKRKLTFK